MRDWLILMGLGGLFIFLGIGSIIWGRNEEKSYFDTISRRTDVREYLSHWPPRVEPKALRIGGIIAIVVGVALAIGGILIKMG
ncbi:MAG: hypothetical protein HY665_04210 [Chloroflexi bacterium]|nr:hypothetical protein [Chloroflexota bacterium]